MAMKFWVVPDVTDDKKLAVIGASFQPNNAIALAPIDSLTGDVEDQEWLQKEISAGVEIITVDQPKKDQILLDRATIKAAEKTEKDRIKQIKQDLKKLSVNDVTDIVGIRDVLTKIIDVLNESNK